MANNEKTTLDAELERMPTVKGLFDRTLCIQCPTCGACIPERDVRSVLERILREANPEMCKKLFGA